MAKEREALDVRAQLDQANAQIARYSKADMLADPIGFAQAHQLTEQEMALIGQAYLYHLVPDKAPPDLRYKMLEAKTARERRIEADRQQVEALRADQAQVAQRIEHFHAGMVSAVQTWDAGPAHPFPESQAWFGPNQEEYAQSMLYTANNLAEAARQRGEAADLTPKAVAAALERDLATRAARIRGSKPTQQGAMTSGQTPAVGGKQPTVLSTKGQGASPAPKATTDEERVKRAMDVVFGR